MHISWLTYRRMLQEGFDAWKLNGPGAVCPYGSDERNGIWVFGKQKAKAGSSFAQACRSFRRMEELD